MSDQNPSITPGGGGYVPQGGAMPTNQPHQPGQQPVDPVYQTVDPSAYPGQQPVDPVYQPVDPTAYPGQQPADPSAYPAQYPPDQGAYTATYPPPDTPGYPPQPPAKKKGKTWLVLVLVLAVLLLGGGGAAAYFLIVKNDSKPTADASPTPTVAPTRPTVRPTALPTGGAGQAYTSPLGFTVTIPQGWTSKLDSNQETFSNGLEDERFAVILVVDHGIKMVDPEAFMNDLLKRLQNEQGYRVEQAPQKITFGSIPAVRARFGFQQNGYQVVVEIYALKGADGRLYQVEFAGSTEYFVSHLQAFQQFETTFRPTGGPATP